MPKAVKDWSLRTLQIKLIKMGGRIVHHARRIVFQLAEVAVPRELLLPSKRGWTGSLGAWLGGLLGDVKA